MRPLIAAFIVGAASVNAGAFELKGLVLGSPTTPDAVHQAMGVKCGEGANGMQVCNGPSSIGGVSGYANIVINAKGTLQRISFSFDSGSFFPLAEAFEEKYGKHATRRLAMQNGFGAKIDSVEKIWSKKDGRRIELEENSGRIGKALALFTTQEDRGLIDKVNKADRSDM
jgi:hypothetical protein